MKLSARVIAMMALLIALSIILTRFASFRLGMGGVEIVRIGFGALPIILSAVLYGPIGGAVVGALADLVGYPFLAMGAYMPHFTLTSALSGFIPGLILAIRRSHGNPDALDLAIAITVGQLVTAVWLVPVFINQLWGVPLTVLLPPRLVSQAVQIPLYVLFCRVLIVRLRFAFHPPQHACSVRTGR